jgi:hypothetical protein
LFKGFIGLFVLFGKDELSSYFLGVLDAGRWKVAFKGLEEFLVTGLGPVEVDLGVTIYDVPPKTGFEAVFNEDAVVAFADIGFISGSRCFGPADLIDNADKLAEITISVSKLFFLTYKMEIVDMFIFLFIYCIGGNRFLRFLLVFNGKKLGLGFLFVGMVWC